jgi:hypothetical protein
MKNIGEERKIVSYLPLGLADMTIFPTVVHQRLASSEGLEKVTRGGVNGSQSKFLKGTWLISQNQPDALSSNSAKTAQL